MATETAAELLQKHCRPCEGGVTPVEEKDAKAQLESLPGWRLTHGGKRIRRDWTLKDFMAGLEFFQQVAQLAEQEEHHPDLHLEGYRQVWIELSTHAIDGLSENDFILAAKINEVPVKEKARK